MHKIWATSSARYIRMHVTLVRIFYNAGETVVNMTKIRAILRPEVWRHEFQSFTLKELDYLLLVHSLAKYKNLCFPG